MGCGDGHHRSWSKKGARGVLVLGEALKRHRRLERREPPSGAATAPLIYLPGFKRSASPRRPSQAQHSPLKIYIVEPKRFTRVVHWNEALPLLIFNPGGPVAAQPNEALPSRGSN